MRIISFFIITLFTFSLSAQDVIQWRGDRTGIYKETGLLKTWGENGPALLWHFDGLDIGFSSVAISKDKLYVTGMTDGTGYIYVLDMQGKLLNKTTYGTEWTRSYEGSRSTIIPDDGRLYYVTGMGALICFDEADLCIVWQKHINTDFGGNPPQHGVHESPLIVGDKLIFTPGGKEHNIVALNKKTGDLIWTTEAKGDVSSYCNPIFADDQEVPQIITMTGHHVVGIDINNGNMLWSHPFTNRFYEHPNTPAYADGMVLCTSSYGVGSIMLRLKNGGRDVEQVWSDKELDSRTGHMLKIGNYAYGAGDYGKGSWYCVDWQTGKQQYKDRSIAPGAIIAAEGLLYCYTEKGELALVRATPEKFDIVSQLKITMGTGSHWAHPVIYKGVLYVRHGDTLMAYKITD